MARTTLDIDTAVLEALRERARCEHRTMGQLASELLARALFAPSAERPARPDFSWPSTPMGARIDLEDKDALWAVPDREHLALGE